ncbi:MAG: hypothetical protein K9J27_00105 [Bacteroidales bacterium]|nr:hypothetical protein [Bacteroidales bacterium]MCF8333350.1 hypothetical protein [Bacteroidales bacterium]
MNNEIFWIILLLANFGLILLSYRIFGKTRLFIWVPIAAIVANIQVIQTIHLFGFTAIAFIGVYPTGVLIEILFTTYFLKWIVAAADTPSVYVANIIKSRKYVG